MDFGSHVKAARKRAGLTQEKLAESIHVSPGFISAIERGLKAPSLDVLSLLCTTLGVSADELLFGKDKLLANSDIVLQTVSGCSEQEVQLLLKLARVMKEFK